VTLNLLESLESLKLLELAKTVGGAAGFLSLWLQLQKTWVRIKIIPSISRRELLADENSVGSYRTFPYDSISRLLLPEDKTAAVKYDVCLSLRIVNLSNFTVSIADAGYFDGIDVLAVRSSMAEDVIIHAPFHAEDSTGKIRFPVKLESRESMLVIFGWLNKVSALNNSFRYAYARTACGTTKKKEASEVVNYCIQQNEWRKDGYTL
jgi:hypothetical protein